MKKQDFECITYRYELLTYNLWALEQIPFRTPQITDKIIKLIFRLEIMWRHIAFTVRMDIDNMNYDKWSDNLPF